MMFDPNPWRAALGVPVMSDRRVSPAERIVQLQVVLKTAQAATREASRIYMLAQLMEFLTGKKQLRVIKKQAAVTLLEECSRCGSIYAEAIRERL